LNRSFVNLLDYSIYVDGNQKARDFMNNILPNIGEAVTGSLADAAQIMLASAVAAAPVYTGRLRGSLTAVSSGSEAVVGTNTEYAPFVEFGTGQRGTASGAAEYPLPEGVGYSPDRKGTEAQPFLRPALYDNIPLIQENLRKFIEESLIR
jgi:HK97 gp10 family phage protein